MSRLTNGAAADGKAAPAPEAAAHPLAGIPGIGPARRALLEAAGITTREGLARASVEQVVSITGMPRAAAERVLSFLAEAPGPDEALSSAPMDEAFPTTEEPAFVPSGAVAVVPPAPPPDGVTPEEEQVMAPSSLERAVFAARTALSDVTRLSAERPRLERALARFALLLDALPDRLPKLRPGAQRRLTRRLEKLTARLERLTAAGPEGQAPRPVGPRRAERLRERLRAERRDLAALARLAAPARKGKARR